MRTFGIIFFVLGILLLGIAVIIWGFGFAFRSQANRARARWSKLSFAITPMATRIVR